MNTAVIGLGIGMAHVAGYLAHADARLTAVADRLPERRRAVGGTFAAGSMRVLEPLFEDRALLARPWEAIGVAAHEDAQAVIDDPAIDLVSLCTPDDTHEELAIRLLEAGKAVLLEKPVALTLEGAERVARAAEDAAGRGAAPAASAAPAAPTAPTGIGYEFRLNPAVRELRRLVADGSLGEPRAFALYHYRTPFRRDKYQNWIQDRRRSGGLLVEETCHWFDLARFVIGDEVARVSCVGVDDIHPDFDFEDLAFVQGRYRRGAVFQISHSLTGFDFSLVLQVHGTAGTAWCGLKEERYSSLDAGRTDYLGVLSTAPLNATPADATVTTWGPEATEPFNIRDCAMAAVDAVTRTRGSRQDRSEGLWPASLEDGIASLRIALAARQSLETGKEIAL